MKINFVYKGFENIGIEYLSSVLKNGGHETKLTFDPSLFYDQFIKIKLLGKFFDYRCQIIKQVIDYKPKLVAFSVISSDYQWALEIAQEIKRRLSVYIVFGGIHPTSVPEIVLENNCVDSVVLGEGEFALLELANSLERGILDYSIKNIWFKCNGNIIKNPLRPYIDNLDSLPFPDKELYYDVIPRYKNGYTIITRRGCINSCSYCHNTIWQMRYPNEEKRIRLRSLENVFQELIWAKKKYNFRLLRINDDLFTYNEDWLKAFSQRYKKEIGVPLYCFGSPSTTNERVIKYLRDASCYQLCLGVQSVNIGVRKEILHRSDTDEQIKKAINLCREYRIRCVADNIIGLPDEKEEDMLEMAKFYNQYRVGRICIFWLIYFPRTTIVDIALKKGILDRETVTNLEKNPFATANTLQNRIHEKGKIRYHLLLLLLCFFPKGIYNWFIEKKLYRFLPLVNPTFIEIPLTMLAKDRLDIPRRRYYIRYMYFIPKISMLKLKDKIGRIYRTKFMLSSKNPVNQHRLIKSQ